MKKRFYKKERRLKYTKYKYIFRKCTEKQSGKTSFK